MAEKLCDLFLHLHAKTAKALLLSTDGDEARAKWIPRSQIEFEIKLRNGVDVTMPEWLAIKSGFV